MDKRARTLVRFAKTPVAASLLAAAVIAAAAGCTAAGDLSAGLDTTGGDDAVGTIQQEADVACTVAEPHGSDAGGNGYDVVLGCGCRAGSVRDSFIVRNTGQGSCNAVGAGWLPGSDAHDCRVMVHVQNAVFGGNGLCTVEVDERPDPCAHNSCTEGAALASTCSASIARVCSSDGFCCTTQWDRQCVDEVASIANSLVCTSPPCPHAACATGVAMPSSCSAAVSQICAADSFCCTTSWDGACVSEVSTVAHKTCN